MHQIQKQKHKKHVFIGVLGGIGHFKILPTFLHATYLLGYKSTSFLEVNELECMLLKSNIFQQDLNPEKSTEGICHLPLYSYQ